MFIDNYAFNQPIIFEHKERVPRFIAILDISFLLGTFIMIVAYVCLVPLHASGYVFTKRQENILIISFVIFCCFGFFVAILNLYNERFNFHYTITFDENSFTIGSSAGRTFETLRFYRKITYDFKEIPKIVYMRDYKGNQYVFKYDENFRKFLEEIQII